MLFSGDAAQAAVHQAICRAFLPSVLATFLHLCSNSPHREAIAHQGRFFHSEREADFQNRPASQRLTQGPGKQSDQSDTKQHPLHARAANERSGDKGKPEYTNEVGQAEKQQCVCGQSKTQTGNSHL